MKIYTSYFGNLKHIPSKILPVSIARFPPRWYKGHQLKSLAPPKKLLWKAKQGKIDRQDYTARYLGEIEKRFTPRLQREEAEDPDIITLVATENGTLVGASLSKMDTRNQAWLDRLHLLPGYFGSGLAQDLLHATIAKHTGLQTIALKVLKSNERAIGFYEKHGFSITDEIPRDDTVGGADSVVMTRTIPRS